MKNGERLARGSLAKRRPSNVLSSFLDFAFFCRACEPSKVLRLPAKTKVRPCAQRVESPAPWRVKKQHKTSKTKAKIDPKSSKMARRARPGELVAQLCRLLGFPGQPCRSTVCARRGSVKRSEATKLAPGGQSESARPAWLAQACTRPSSWTRLVG